MARIVGSNFACENVLLKSSPSLPLLLSSNHLPLPKDQSSYLQTENSVDTTPHRIQTTPHTNYTTYTPHHKSHHNKSINHKMQFRAYLLSLLATASTIQAQAMINWAFYEPGSECSKNWRDEPINEDYWTAPDGHCLPMNTRSGEYDVVVNANNVGLNTINPAMYACPDKECDLEDCALMTAEGWGGQGLGCQHLYNAPYWWIEGVTIPMKREVEGNEITEWEEGVLGPREVVNETKSENEPRLRAMEFKA